MNELKKLLAKDIFDCLSETERERLNVLRGELGIDEERYGELKRRVTSEALHVEIMRARAKSRRMTLLGRWAAVLILPLTLAAYFFFQGQHVDELVVEQVVCEAKHFPAPERKEPMLILGDGRQINLSRKNEEECVEENVVNRGKELVYSRQNGADVTEKGRKEQAVFHTVIVPKGGEFSVTLEDGTRVWFNENSQVRYPAFFAESGREIFLEKGEIYLEVEHEKERPFVVHTEKGDVRVLGTCFDVKTLENGMIATTLVQGKVEVTREDSRVVLYPNQQAVVGEGINVTCVNVEEVICWKDNQFFFKDVRLEKIMDKLAAWYGFTVFYENPGVKDEKFFVSVDKYADGDKILKLLEEVSEVRFQVDGSMVKVFNKKN